MTSGEFPPIILGSGSPRRRQILEFLEIPHTVMMADVDERALRAISPREFALKAAFTKACALDSMVAPGTIVIAADTVVALDGKIFFKPDDASAAVQMLSELSGKTHQVITGLAVRETGHATQLDAATTMVTLRTLTENEISDYVATGEPLDKAGSYGIQGRGGELIDGIDGDYFNVVGLPVDKLLDLLDSHGDTHRFRERRRGLTRNIFGT